MKPGWPIRIAVALLGALELALLVAAIPLTRATDHSLGGVFSQSAIVLLFAIVGLTVAFRQPRNALGWILTAVAVFFVVQDDASLYNVYDYRMRGGHLALGPLSVLVQPSWAPAIVCMVLTLLLFPDARLPLGRWHWMLWPFLGMAALWMLTAYGIALDQIVRHTVTIAPSGDLTQLNDPRGDYAWWGLLQNVFFIVVFASGIASIVRQVRRFRHADGEERMQLKWLIAGGTVFAIGGFLTVSGSGKSSSWITTVISNGGTVALVALPISIGIAILKYRLFDIDQLISRTVSYAIITAMLVGTYVGLVALTTRALPLSSPVGVAASTLAAAALFAPLRRFVQHRVDRRFNRSAYDAEAMIQEFRARLRNEVDITKVRAELLSVVERAVQPAGAELWVVERIG